MRRSVVNAGRILTIVSLVVLITLSFIVFTGQESHPHVASRHFAHKRNILARAEEASPTPSQSPSPSTTSTVSTTPSPTTTATSSSSFTSHTSSSTSEVSSTPTTTTTSSSTPRTTSSPSSSSTSSTKTSTTTTPISTTSTHSKTSSSTTSSSTFSSSSKVASTLKVTNLPSSSSTIQSTLIIETNIYHSATGTDTSVEPTESASGDVSSAGASTKSGFFGNTGAVAATFSVVGIVVVGAACAAVVFIRKRKRSEDHDIFESEYNAYSGSGGHGGRGDSGDYIVSDMTSLSANGASLAGAHTSEYESHDTTGEYDYGHSDFGFGTPPTTQSNRSSTLSNHAGYGVYQAPAPSASARKPTVGSSRLRNEASWSADAAYTEPAVGEDQSIYITSASQARDSFYGAQEHAYNMTVGTAH